MRSSNFWVTLSSIFLFKSFARARVCLIFNKAASLFCGDALIASKISKIEAPTAFFVSLRAKCSPF